MECVLTDKFNDGLYEASLVDRTEIADTLAQEIESRLDGGKLGHGPYVDSESLRDDLTERFGFFYDIDFSGLTFKTSLILSVKSLYFEGDVVDSALDWQADYLPCVCHRGGQGENDRWEYEPTDDYRPFTRPADIPESIFDKLCASQGTTIEKVVNDPVTKFERSFREDIFNSQQNSLVGLTVLATLPLDAFLDASLSMICRGDREKAGTFTVKPGTYEPIMGIYDPINGCGGTAGIELDTDFDIDPRDIKYTMMEPRGGSGNPTASISIPRRIASVLRALCRAYRVFREEAQDRREGEARSRRPRTPRECRGRCYHPRRCRWRRDQTVRGTPWPTEMPNARGPSLAWKPR
ncbi:MAG: hypothetical protein ACLT98_00570 [Eggerthellaceae bacterium]